jgi:hypothetical protein
VATRDGRGGSAICKPILLLLTELTLFRLAPRRKTLKKTGKEGMHLGGSQAPAPASFAGLRLLLSHHRGRGGAAGRLPSHDSAAPWRSCAVASPPHYYAPSGTSAAVAWPISAMSHSLDARKPSSSRAYAREKSLFLEFSLCLCLEPVLAKSSFLCRNGSKDLFFSVSQCLSRARPGETIVVLSKWRPERRFPPHLRARLRMSLTALRPAGAAPAPRVKHLPRGTNNTRPHISLNRLGSSPRLANEAVQTTMARETPAEVADFWKDAKEERKEASKQRKKGRREGRTEERKQEGKRARKEGRNYHHRHVVLHSNHPIGAALLRLYSQKHDSYAIS